MKRLTFSVGVATLLLSTPFAFSDEKKGLSGEPESLLGGYTIVAGEHMERRRTPGEELEGVTVEGAHGLLDLGDARRGGQFEQ